MGPCVASVQSDGALIAAISGGGETLSVIPVSNATNLNGVGAGMVGWTLIAADAVEAASTTTVLNLTSHVARVGDAIFSQTGTAANQRAWSIVSAVTANTVTLANALPSTPTLSDQVLIMRPVLIAASGAPSGQSGTAIMANIDSGYQNATSTGILKLEDAASASGDAGVATLAQRLDQLATGQTGSNNDYAVPVVDTLSRLYVNPWGAAVTEFSSSCTSAITGTSRTAIKAAVASNRIYTTSITCSNSGAAASIFNISDGAGAVLAVGALAATVGSYTASFPVPLRGSSNTDLSVTMNTTSTSTICCANGFISPY